MKKTLCVILILATTLLAACGHKNENSDLEEKRDEFVTESVTEEESETEETKFLEHKTNVLPEGGNDEEYIKLVVQNYYYALEAYDFEAMKSCVMFPEELDGIDVTPVGMVREICASFGMDTIMPQEAYENITQKIVDVYSYAMERLDVEIADIVTDGDSATVSATLTYYDILTVVDAATGEVFNETVAALGYGDVEDPTTLTNEDWEKIALELEERMRFLIDTKTPEPTEPTSLSLEKKDARWYVVME